MTTEIKSEPTGPYKIGQTITLVSYTDSGEAYTDQCGKSHSGRILLEFTVVTVVESRTVNGSWQPDREYIGYRAVSEDGREFHCQWHRFDDCSTQPYQNWDLSPFVDNGDPFRFSFYSADHILNFSRAYPLVDKKGQPVKEAPGVSHCAKHNNYWQNGEEICFYCKHNFPER